LSRHRRVAVVAILAAMLVGVWAFAAPALRQDAGTTLAALFVTVSVIPGVIMVLGLWRDD